MRHRCFKESLKLIWKYRINVITFVRMNAKKKEEKRLNKGYKVKDSAYRKAIKRGTRDKRPLAQLLESVVEAYANGFEILHYDHHLCDYVKM